VMQSTFVYQFCNVTYWWRSQSYDATTRPKIKNPASTNFGIFLWFKNQ